MHKENVSIDEQVCEISRCAVDFDYFCSTYVFVTNPNIGLAPLQLYEFQKRFFEAMQDNQLLLVPKFRKGGFTTVTVAYCLWKAIFDNSQYIMWLSPSDREAIAICQMFRNMRSNLPSWMIEDVEICNDHQVHLTNGNRIYFYTPVAGRGRIATLMVIDDSVYVNKMHEAWQTIMPCVYPNGKVIAISSAKVLQEGERNWFYETLLEAKAGKNDFAVFQAKWHEHPEYDNKEHTDRMRVQLGDIGWRIEIDGEFVIHTKEEYNYLNTLKMAGVLNDQGTVPLEADYRESLVKKITKGLPSQLKVDLEGNTISINGIPTKINTKAVKMAVLGLAELSGQDRAVATVGRIVRKKLQRLF